MKTILVVDDDERISAAVAIRLRAAGYEAVTASDGVKGLELALEHQVSLIITDIWMTIGNGFSLAHRLRSALPRVPVLFMTASKRPGLREMAAQSGAAGFFEKPFDMQAMMAAVEICVGPGEGRESAPSVVLKEPESTDQSASVESQAEVPDSPVDQPSETIIPPPTDLAPIELAPAPAAESPGVETPPPLPPSVVSTPVPEPPKATVNVVPLPAPEPAPTESGALPEPLSSPPVESAKITATPADAPIEEPPKEVSGLPDMTQVLQEIPIFSKPVLDNTWSEPAAEPPTEQPRVLPSAESMGSKRILIADTDEPGANLLADRFRDLGHEVSVAHDPAGAVDCVMECQPDLAVIDLAMPGSSGFTVARQIQTLASDPVAIIFTTGKRRVEYRKLAEQSDAVGLFEKPYHADELLQAAVAALERSVPVAG